MLVDAIFVHQTLFVLNAYPLYFYKAMSVKLLVIMDLHHLETNVLAAQLDVFNAHKISIAIIVLIICLYTKEAVLISALLELLEINQLEIGNAFLAILHAKHV